jgi:hypothetical protein
MKKEDPSRTKTLMKTVDPSKTDKTLIKKEDFKTDPAKTLSNWKGVQNKTSFLGSAVNKFNTKATGFR